MAQQPKRGSTVVLLLAIEMFPKVSVQISESRSSPSDVCSWKDEALLDIERPLNGRGRKASQTVGHFLGNTRITPDLVLSSSAIRARQTTDIVLETAKLNTDLCFDERIYDASGHRLLEVVRQIDKSKKTVLLVGHNPGLEEFLELLTGAVEAMPTGTLSKLTLKASDWEDVSNNGGTLEWIVRPKELKKV
jgi:phosphohistidine phosphatase